MGIELGNVLSGARAKLSLGGEPIFYATNVNYGEQINYDPVEVLNKLEVAEHVPTSYTVSFSSQHVRVVSKPIKNRGGLVIFPKLSDILRGGELTASVTDSVTGEVLGNIIRCKASRYTINIGARGIVMTDVEWVAIRIQDESELSA